MNNTPTLAQVVGQNARKIRGNHRQDEVAGAARGLGLKWNTGRVSALERGEVSPTVPTLLVLAMSLSEVAQVEVGLADLAAHDGPVEITPSFTMDGSALVDALTGTPADLRRTDGEEVEHALMTIAARQAGGEAELRAAVSLGITPQRFVELSAQLWRRTYLDERDARAGTDANAQRRGRVARELKAELKAALGGDADGNDQ